MKAIEVRVFPVNLQQGFFVNDRDTIIAAYSHHKKRVIFKVPFRIKDVILPVNYMDYELVERETGSFFISKWFNNAPRDI